MYLLKSITVIFLILRFMENQMFVFHFMYRVGLPLYQNMIQFCAAYLTQFCFIYLSSNGLLQLSNVAWWWSVV